MFVLYLSGIINHMCPQEISIWFCWYLFAIYIQGFPKTAEWMKVAFVRSSSSNQGMYVLLPQSAVSIPLLCRLTF